MVPLTAARPTARESREELLAAVLEDRADDAPRHVLADWLMERGDPRGEFISIQCEVVREHGLKEREAALLADNREAWSTPGLSSSRQSTNQVLKELEARGYLKVSYGEIELVDISALRSLAHGG